MTRVDSVSAEVATMLSTCSTCSTCRPWAEQDEGPYHRDSQPERRDVVEDREGITMQLGIRLAHADHRPPGGALVEIWQCDALGRYSGFPPPNDSVVVTADNAPRAAYLRDQSFLRGRQPADANGMVEFLTIYPGWYPGRTVHIHLMVHIEGRVLTSQLYFPDETNDEVLARTPYATRAGRDTRNDTDEILPAGGAPAVLDIIRTADGYRAGICLVLPASLPPSSRPV